MSKIDKCINCEHCQLVGDGYGLCTKDAICVTVIDNYEPTKYLAYCEEDKMKTVYQMCNEGWCDDCLGNPAECLKNGKCKGYEKEEEREDIN